MQFKSQKPELDNEALAALPPEKQDEARALLATLEREYKRNPLLRYEPHPKQAVFHASHAALKAFLGGNRSGKTTAGILDDLIQAIDRGAVPPSLMEFKKWEPPFYCRIIAPDFISTMEGVIFQKLKEWCPPEQLVGGSWAKGYDKARRRLNFKNGSWFDFLSFEQDLDKFGGAALHRVHFDEEPPRSIRRESLMRLIDYGGDELFTMTPLHGMSWMYDEIWEPWQHEKLRDAIVVTVDMDDNPHLNQATKERVLAGLTNEERSARKSGLFVHFAGMIYSDFDRTRHVTRELTEMPKAYKVYVGIDPGIRHMAAVVWVLHTPDDVMTVFDELALQGMTVAEVAKAIHIVNTKHKIVPNSYWIDPAAQNRSTQTGRSDQQEFVEHGIIAIPGQNSVTAGINKVKERLQTDRLMIAANCGTTIDEFRKYRWKPLSRSQDDPKEEPVKADDHLLDALRYVVMSMPVVPDNLPIDVYETPVEKALREDMEGKNYRKIKPINTDMGAIFL